MEGGASRMGSQDGASLRDAFGDPLPAPLAQIVQTLLDRKILRSAPRQCSVNYYDKPSYCMVPHKDGYSDQACILSLGSDSALRFWREPMDEAERRARDMLHGSHSGTAVYAECLHRPPDCSVWMEPGSALVLEGAALYDYVHGLPSTSHDLFDGTAANARLVSPAALRARAAGTGGGAVASVQARHASPQRQREVVPPISMPRLPRVSVVVWTDFTPPAAA